VKGAPAAGGSGAKSEKDLASATAVCSPKGCSRFGELTLAAEEEVQPQHEGVDAQIPDDVLRVPAATAAAAALRDAEMSR